MTYSDPDAHVATQDSAAVRTGIPELLALTVSEVHCDDTDAATESAPA